MSTASHPAEPYTGYFATCERNYRLWQEAGSLPHDYQPDAYGVRCFLCGAVPGNVSHTGTRVPVQKPEESLWQSIPRPTRAVITVLGVGVAFVVVILPFISPKVEGQVIGTVWGLVCCFGCVAIPVGICLTLLGIGRKKR